MQKYLEVLSFKPASKSLDTLKTSVDEIFDLAIVILNGISVAEIGNVNSMILPLSMITKYGDVEPIVNK
ncbi:37420_t:CDS:2 [Gigaspora margarita]|uniref:37420_t:CDS:1 n=1 Tax=Gigaspora margarita TaxID=4874 RepID=A0ABN7UQA9_GIGMA|nr:37420_t:CDS:2 [Gigaspora margarita]